MEINSLQDSLKSLMKKAEMIIMSEVCRKGKIVFETPININFNTGIIDNDENDLDEKILSICGLENPHIDMDQHIIYMDNKKPRGFFIHVKKIEHGEDIYLEDYLLNKNNIIILKIADAILKKHESITPYTHHKWI